MGKAVNVLALVRDEHRFVFLYDDNSIETVLATLSQYASDPELEFTWYDAAMMAQRVRALIEEQDCETGIETEFEGYPNTFLDLIEIDFRRHGKLSSHCHTA